MTFAAPTIWPALRYDDAPAALRFLVDVLGFHAALVVPDDVGDIVHAELHWPEGGSVMLGSTKHCEGTHAMPAGATSAYVVTDHVDAAFQRCVSAGAAIVSGPEDTDYGSHTFSVRDPEGNLWTLGTYRGTPPRPEGTGIRRAMPVVRSADIEASRAFYVGFLGFDVGMDEAGFLMLRSPSTPTTQLIVATAAAADQQVLGVDISLEVADVDAVHAEAVRLGLEIVHPLTDEAWGIRRFFVRDPDGLVVNVTSHIPS